VNKWICGEDKICIVAWMLIAGFYGLPEKALSSKLPLLDEGNILTTVQGVGVSQAEVEENNYNQVSVESSSLIPVSSTSSLSVVSLPINDGINSDNAENNDESMSQVTSVSQLKDVQPTDWAFQALQSLVERYGCIAGYPDSTFKGNRALTRYEFAAGLNACLDRVNELIGTATESAATREDLAKLQKLQEEFSAELVSLRGRVDNLEARSAELEANQFSTTTKLFGVAIIGIQGRTNNRADIAPRDGIKDSSDRGTNTSIVNLNQIFLNTQFDPQSYLVTGLLASKGGTGPRLGNDLILGYEFPTNNDFILSDLRYHRLLSKNFAMMVGSTNVNMTNAFRGPNRVESGATGPISLFAQRNPILNMGFTGQAGLAFDWQFAKRASLQAVYASYNAANPDKRNGLFDGNTTAAVQLLVTPTDAIDVSLYYLNNYSANGCLLTFVGDDCLTAVNSVTNKREPLQTNAVGATVNWQISPKFTLGAWGGYTNSNIPGKSGNVETTNWMVYLNLPDLFRKGNLGGIYIGQPPKITNSTLPLGNNVPDIIDGGLGKSGGQSGTTTQIEAFYRFQVTRNISITPGIIHIIEPGHNPGSDSVTMGVLRSTFAF
jgi:Carbohydrate-selective porin, OprB family/S-layer homology domain